MSDDYDVQRYNFTWGAFAVSNGVAPDSDDAIDVGSAKSIAVQFDTTPTANVSTDVDLNIITSPDGTNWDTVDYAAAVASLGDNAMKTVAITTGINFIKLRADNNDGVNNAAPVARVVVRR